MPWKEGVVAWASMAWLWVMNTDRPSCLSPHTWSTVPWTCCCSTTSGSCRWIWPMFTLFQTALYCLWLLFNLVQCSASLLRAPTCTKRFHHIPLSYIPTSSSPSSYFYETCWKKSLAQHVVVSLFYHPYDATTLNMLQLARHVEPVEISS